MAAPLLCLFLLLTGCAQSDPPLPAEDESGLTVVFLDVGQADSALVLCEGATMLIDGGNAGDSSLLYSFLQQHGISRLDVLVATHPHEDHIGGLPGALQAVQVTTAISPVSEYDSDVFDTLKDSLAKQDMTLTIPQAGDQFLLGGAEVEVLGPIRLSDEPNNNSLVLRLTYGNTSFLFAGDAEREEEQDILEADATLSADVLKVGHHGSDSSSAYPWLRAVMPRVAILSCGADNPYGHPQDNLLSRLRDAEATVYRTDLQGTVTCTSDGQTVSVSVERDSPADPYPMQSPPATAPYIGNVNSHKFHRPDCSGLPAEHNRVLFDSRAQAIGAGYDPCGTCHP